MTRRLLTAILLGAVLTGCQRDPVWLGIWDITSGTRDGVRQNDLGILEVMDGGELAVLLRYQWNGAEFVPDPHPEVVFGQHDARRSDDVFESYKEEGETYELQLAPFWVGPEGADLQVKDHDPNHGVLVGKQGYTWPNRPPDELGSVELRIRR